MNEYHKITEEVMRRAEVQKQKERKRKARAWRGGAIAAAACLTVGCCCAIPFEVGGVNIEPYRDSEYFSVIEALHSHVDPVGRRTSVFQEAAKVIRTLSLKAMDEDDNFDMGATGAAGSETTGSSGLPGYIETTRNQTEGVIEGDLIKRDGNTVYYLQTANYSVDGKLRVSKYLLGEGEAREEGSFVYQGEAEVTGQGELFLSEDCRELYIFSKCHYNSTVMSLFLTIDAQTMALKEERLFSGEFDTARLIGDKFLIFTQQAIRSRPDYRKEETFLPHSIGEDGTKVLPAEDIFISDMARNVYTNLFLWDGAELSGCSVLGRAEVYVSEENVYFACQGLETQYFQFSYTEEIALKNSMTVNGWLNNRYSMDEYEGVFRIAVTQFDHGVKINSLYAYRAEDFSPVGALEGFCKNDEKIMSAHFNGDQLSVCTAKLNQETFWWKDPVFILDLSDYNDIKCVESAEITGYSSHLLPLKESELIGFGISETGDAKIELYREREDSVEIVDQWESESALSTEPKTYFLDEERGFVGASLFGKTGNTVDYVLLRAGEDGLELVSLVHLSDERSWRSASVRAVQKGNTLYVFICPVHEGDGVFVIPLD